MWRPSRHAAAAGFQNQNHSAPCIHSLTLSSSKLPAISPQKCSLSILHSMCIRIPGNPEDELFVTAGDNIRTVACGDFSCRCKSDAGGVGGRHRWRRPANQRCSAGGFNKPQPHISLILNVSGFHEKLIVPALPLQKLLLCRLATSWIGCSRCELGRQAAWSTKQAQ